MLTSILLIVVLGASAPGDVDVKKLLETEREMLQSRRSLSHGRVIVRLANSGYSYDGYDIQTNVTWEITFLGELFKCVADSSGPATPLPAYSLFADHHVVDTGSKGVISRWPQRPKNDERRLNTLIPNPLLFGLVPWTADQLNKRGFGYLFLNPRRERFSIRHGEHNGLPITEVSCMLSHGDKGATEISYGLSPTQGNFPVFITLRGFGATHTLDVALQEVPPGVWYPKTVVYELVESGDHRPAVRQEIQVLAADFASAVRPSEFTLAGLGIPDDRVIKDLETGRTSFLSGGRLVPSLGRDSVQTLPDRSMLVRRWLTLAGAAAVLAGAFLLARRLRASGHGT